MNICVVIPAAGFSRRFAAAPGALGVRSKLDEDLGGRPVLQRTVELFKDLDAVGSILVAGPHDEGAMRDFRLRHNDRLSILGVRIVPGGRAHRWETVHAALTHVPNDATHIAVHDAARPCTPPDLIERLFSAAEKHPAVVPALDVSDTLKRVREEAPGAAPAQDDDPIARILGEDAGGAKPRRYVEETIARARVVAAQTPQVFRADLLRRAYAAFAGAASGTESGAPVAGTARPRTPAGDRGCADAPVPTDDAALVERLGEPVLVIEGDPRNIKITRPIDLAIARSVMGFRGPDERPVHKRF